eukprot:COSAG01_NODE_261_length_20040_cov_33.761496_12_plen_77_part_00
MVLMSEGLASTPVAKQSEGGAAGAAQQAAVQHSRVMGRGVEWGGSGRGAARLHHRAAIPYMRLHDTAAVLCWIRPE